MKSLKKLVYLLCIGAVYNLYFTLLHSDSGVWLNVFLFLLFGYGEILLLDLLFKKSRSFQKNTYLQITTIFLLSSLVEILYMLVTGLSLTLAIHLVLLGIPITLVGLLYWKQYTRKIDKLLKHKKSSLVD